MSMINCLCNSKTNRPEVFSAKFFSFKRSSTNSKLTLVLIVRSKVCMKLFPLQVGRRRYEFWFCFQNNNTHRFALVFPLFLRIRLRDCSLFSCISIKVCSIKSRNQANKCFKWMLNLNKIMNRPNLDHKWKPGSIRQPFFPSVKLLVRAHARSCTWGSNPRPSVSPMNV